MATDIRVALGGVEPPVAGLRVQLYDDAVAPHLVVENLTDAPLEILDAQGRAFVRITPHAVEADLAAAAWYRSLSPGGAAAAPDAIQPEPRWQSVRGQPAWNWFDPRLERKAPGPWRIPARHGGQPIEIQGHFTREPPAGAFVARLTTSAALAPDVRVELVPGRPPELFLENNGVEAVTVIGAQAEPFVRITVQGVEANLASATWQDLGRYKGLAEPSEGPERWQRIALVPRFAWLEPRAGMPAGSPVAGAPDNTRSKVKGWQVPVLVGRRMTAIQGVVEWVPVARQTPR